MTCDFFLIFLTVFQSYQHDGRVIIKRCVLWNYVYDWKGLRLERGSNPDPLNIPAFSGLLDIDLTEWIQFLLMCICRSIDIFQSRLLEIFNNAHIKFFFVCF